MHITRGFTMHDSLTAAMLRAGVDISPIFNVGFLRNGAQWFTGKEAKVGGKTLRWAAFGDLSRSLSEKWDDSGDTNPEERKVIDEFIQNAAAENRRERERYWEQLLPDVASEWAQGSDLGVSPYFEKKGLAGLHGCRLEAHERGARTLVPARDVSGTLYGYQRIFSEKLSGLDTDKLFRPGARKEGCFHLLGPSSDAPSVLYLCEGIATAITVSQALPGQMVVSCFDAGNLIHVAKALRGKYPGAHFVFCADNDRFPAKDGKIYFTGEKKANDAATAVGNARVVVVQFEPRHDETRPTDFDDLRSLAGIEEVERQLLSEPAAPSTLRALDARDAKGKPAKPGEAFVAHTLLRHYGDRLLCQGRDLFVYECGAWVHQTEDKVKRLKRELAQLYGWKAGSKDIKNAFDYFLLHAPTPPPGVDLFVPHFWSANFTNGTLHLQPVPGGKPVLEFRPHNPLDYCTTQLPFEFPGLHNLSAVNAEWEAMLDRVWAGDKDAGAKRRVLAQLMGLCLVPCYSKIFFFLGKKGSGKSTILKIINRFIDPKNISRVDPSYFSGFHMETMPGKLVNMDTDISTKRPIHDDIVKKITDRVAFRVSRKFQTDLNAPLPPVHLFGCNEMPPSLEGSSGAYERRVVILRFGAFSAESLGPGGYDLDFDAKVWGAGREGILAFAIRGLVDLIESRGHVAVPESSREELLQWDAQSDVLGQFLDAVEHQEIDGQNNQFFVGTGAEISRRDLWEAFNGWQNTFGDRRAPWDQRKLCSALRQKGFGEKVIKGVRYWGGIGRAASGESAV